jgi:hypothetical protein
MFGERESETTVEYFLRIVARAASVVCLAIIFLFFLSEDFEFANVTAGQWIGFGFFPVGVLVGLVLAWEEELIGGAITLASVAGFYLVYGWFLNSTFRMGWAFLPFIIPGLLFLAYGYLRITARRMIPH